MFDTLRQRIFRYYESQRIINHLIGAKKLVLRTDDTQFSVRQRKKRETWKRGLDEYIDRKQFPSNNEYQKQVPMIRGNNNTLCAMAYLIDRSGYPSLVDGLQEEGNTKYIREFTNPRLSDWLNDNGMKVEEAIRIQPSYTTYAFQPSEHVSVFIVYLVFGLLYALAVYLQNRFINFKSVLQLKDNNLDSYSGYKYIKIIGLIYLILLLFPRYIIHVDTSEYPIHSGQEYVGTTIDVLSILVLGYLFVVNKSTTRLLKLLAPFPLLIVASYVRAMVYIRSGIPARWCRFGQYQSTQCSDILYSLPVDVDLVFYITFDILFYIALLALTYFFIIRSKPDLDVEAQSSNRFTISP